MGKKKKDRKRMVLLCVATGILVSAAVVVGPVRAWKAYHDKEVREQRERPRQYTIWDEEYVQAQILVYLEERYHEKFVMKGYISYLGEFAGNYVSMEVWPEGKEDNEHLFKVKGYRNEDDELDYYDSYVYLRLEKEMEEYVQPVIGEYFDDDISYWVQFSREVTCEHNLPVEISVEDLLKLDPSKDYEPPNLIIEVQTEQQKDYNYGSMSLLAKELQDNRFRGKLTIRFRGEHNESYGSYLFDIDEDEIVNSGDAAVNTD